MLLTLSSLLTFAQEPVVIDEVVSVIGDEIITKSELESQIVNMTAQGMKLTDQSRCRVLEDILYSKTLLNQAKVDSIEVSDQQVEGEMDRRLRHIIGQIGSEEKLVEYYKKPISQIKDEMRKSMRDQMLIQQMQADITSDVSITPKEVEDYFDRIPEDSLPLVNARVEMAQIVVNAKTSRQAIEAVKEKLRNYRKRVLEGEKFSTLAVLYSEDQGSAANGGEIGFVGKAEVEPEFAAAAFKLKQGGVSPIVKTQFGYHIIEMIERRGNKINVRHILLKPKQDQASFEKAKQKLDSINTLIELDSLTFKEAAKRYSDDEDTKKNGGVIVNPYTASSMIPMDELDPATFMVIDNLEEGEISEPVRIQNPRKKPGYRIIKLLERTEPHRANLKQDYQNIKAAAKAEKEQEVLQEWVSDAVTQTYISIDEEYAQGCEFKQNWTNKIE